MKALILNSGLGRRMGSLTAEQPKCMTPLGNGQTIVSRQLCLLQEIGVHEVVMTTGAFEDALRAHCEREAPGLRFTFVKNPIYDQTNYIYSIHMAKDFLQDDLLLLHGDLVFSADVARRLLAFPEGCMTVSSTQPLPEKDFKAVLGKDPRGETAIRGVGVSFFENAVAAQPFYKLPLAVWQVWLDAIEAFCASGRVNCYAEDAFNEVSDACIIRPLDVEDALCAEVDTPEDLHAMQERLGIL